MKKSIIYASLAALIFSISSCKEDFLETAPTETVSTPPTKYKLNGLYLMMVNKGTGGIGNDYDFGQKGYDIFSDMLSSDMVLGATTYGWYSTLANLSATLDYTDNLNYMPWRYYYRVINGANDVIDGLGGNTANPTGSDGYGMGQAKALRAYGYFYLMQLYTNKYEPGADAIPLYLKSGSPAAPKAKQSEIYGQIVKDLTDAINLLSGYTRPNKGVMNKYVAEGLLAYTYAAMGDNVNAAKYAKDIIDNGGFPVTTKAEAIGGFNTIATPSWMWGFDITLDNSLDLVSWWGQVDLYTYSYAWAGDPKLMDKGLYDSFRSDDVRKSQFGSYGGKNLWPMGKFYDANKVIGGQRKITSDYIFMRVDEFHLLYAEALAKQGGRDAEAKVVLKKYLANRINDASYIDALSGQALLDEIYLQTRMEFWGEGKSYLAMKRNKATVKRGSNHLFFDGPSFSYDDNRLSFKIPQQEINNNPNLK